MSERLKNTLAWIATGFLGFIAIIVGSYAIQMAFDAGKLFFTNVVEYGFIKATIQYFVGLLVCLGAFIVIGVGTYIVRKLGNLKYLRLLD